MDKALYPVVGATNGVPVNVTMMGLVSIIIRFFTAIVLFLCSGFSN